MKIHENSIALNFYEGMAAYFFDDAAPKYYNDYYERPALLSLLPDVNGKKVLDAACAAGWYTQWLLNNGAEVTALDFSSKMIEIVKNRVGENAEIVRADLNYPLDFIENESKNIIISSLTLHYLKDWTSVLNEFYRILDSDGLLIFSVYHPFMSFPTFKKENYFISELQEDEWNINNNKIQVQFYRRPLNMIISSVLDAGFVIEKLLEPMPIDELKTVQPDLYKKLIQEPQFLFIKARKYK